MRHLSTFLCVLALGLIVEMGTSCKKETVSPDNSSVAGTPAKVYQQQDTTTNSQPYNDHQCGQGSGDHVGGQ
jgi:hypothetical protein